MNKTKLLAGLVLLATGLTSAGWTDPEAAETTDRAKAVQANGSQPASGTSVTPASVTVQGRLVDQDGGPIPDKYLAIMGEELLPSSRPLCGGRTDKQGQFRFRGVPLNRSCWFRVRDHKTRRDVTTRPICFFDAGAYQVELRLSRDAEDQTSQLEIGAMTDAEGTEVRGRFVEGNLPAGKPVPAERQRELREILKKMAEVNRYWLQSIPREVRSYEFGFKLLGDAPTRYEVDDASKARGSIRQGITYYSALHTLAAKPNDVWFREAGLDEETVRLVYTLREPMRGHCGNGISGRWSGYFTLGGSEGTLILDARTMVPLASTLSGVTETFSQYVDIGAGHYVPLNIEIEQGEMRFLWRFRAYEPGFWLFAAGERQPRQAGKPQLVASINSVKINGRDAKVLDRPKPLKTPVVKLPKQLVPPSPRAGSSPWNWIMGRQELLGGAEEWFTLLKQNRFDEATDMFDESLKRALPAPSLRDLWGKLEKMGGPFQGEHPDHFQRFGRVRMLPVRCVWERNQLQMRIALNDEGRLTGLWILAGDSDEAPKEFPTSGYRFGPPVEQAAGADFSLEARVVEIDGKPVEKSSITFWWVVDREAEDEYCWRDPVSGKTWQSFGSVSTGDRMTAGRLPPGAYRVTARLGYHDWSTRVGVSEPVHLDGSRKHTIVTVRLVDGSSLTIRPVDAASGEPVSQLDVRLTRDDGMTPPSWRYLPIHNSDPMKTASLPAGTYWLWVGKRALRAGDPDYVAAEQPIKVEMAAGRDKEITVQLRRQQPDQPEIEERWPFVVTGVVTDHQGQPLEGVTIRAHCGMGTLLPRGTTSTDARGQYTLRLAGGWADGAECAVISASKKGFFEKNLSRQGNLLMGSKLPEEGDDWYTERGNLIVPNKPRRVDFVMVPAASVDGTLVDEHGKPIADQYLSTNGLELPPACNALASTGTDKDGGFRVDNVPPHRLWWFATQKHRGRGEIRTQPIALPGPGRYHVKLRLTSDSGGVSLLEIVSTTNPEGVEILEAVLVDDPLAGPPVSKELQAKGFEILKRMAEANRYWLGLPPVDVRSYQYRFHLDGSPPKTHAVTEDVPIPGVVRHGIAYGSGMHSLLKSHRLHVKFHQVEIGNEKITLAYDHHDGLQVICGNRELDPSKGYLSTLIGNGKMVIDARTYALLEHTSGNLHETFSDYVDLGDGHYVPLAIRIDHDPMAFQWRFRVYPPGLWLFDSGHVLLEKGGRPKFSASIDDVKINGQDAQPIDDLKMMGSTFVAPVPETKAERNTPLSQTSEWSAQKAGAKPGRQALAPLDAVRLLARDYRAKVLDGTVPPPSWPEKIRKVGNAWVAEIDTRRLPGGAPEQIVVEVAAVGGGTGRPKYADVAELRRRRIEAETPGELRKAWGALVADLKRRYSGSIDASLIGPPAAEQGVLFSRLMMEWNPVLFKADDLKSIAGKPTREGPRRLEYHFDDGWAGCLWRFTIDATGTITGIEYVPGE